jgi:hypothetical protein
LARTLKIQTKQNKTERENPDIMSTLVAGTVSAASKSATADGTLAHAWEDSAVGGHSWDHAVQEDSEGRIVIDSSETEIIRKRKHRLEQNDYSQRNCRVVRDMIRYLHVIIDASRWTTQGKDTCIVLCSVSRITHLSESCRRDWWHNGSMSR